jgi:hypothetical protein
MRLALSAAALVVCETACSPCGYSEVPVYSYDNGNQVHFTATVAGGQHYEESSSAPLATGSDPGVRDGYVVIQQDGSAGLAIDFRSTDKTGLHSLDDVGAVATYCASTNARLLPVAAPDGSAIYACFEAGKDSVPAVREPLHGTLEVLPPPRQPQRPQDFAYAYNLKTDGTSKTAVSLSVSAWSTSRQSGCKEPE